MRAMKLTIALAGIGLLSGCASPVAGTWTAEGASSPENPIARVSFVEDGTYTAEARYGDKVRASSGHYHTDGDKLILHDEDEGSKRVYQYDVQGSVLTVFHDGDTAKMKRMPGKCPLK